MSERARDVDRKPAERRRRRRRVALIAALAVAAYAAASQLVPDLDLQELLEDVSNTLGDWTYLLVSALAFLETGAFVGLVVPGETVMLLGGAVAGQGVISIWLLIGLAWFSAWAGDSTSFLIGRRLGRSFVLRHGPRFGVSHERFRRVEEYFDRHGGKTILVGRFVGIVRALAPFIAGSSGMRYRDFVPYSILGTGVWATLHIVIGYFASRSIEEAAHLAGRGVFVLGALIVLVVATVVAFRYLRHAENRERAAAWMEERPPTRALLHAGRRVAPQARFVWQRLTPGGPFGLEATSLLAALSVSLFVLVSYAAIVAGDPGPTPGDRTARDIVESLGAGWLEEVAKVVTELGAGSFAVALALVCAVALAAGRHWPEVAVLVAGTVLTVVGVHELKDALDRPRPPQPLVAVEGSGYPSGHAAYSVLYVWLAVTVAIRLRPGMARAGTLVGAGIAVAALVGLSRVYLGVHHLSDVSGGWALGVAAFSLCALVALVSIRLRDNEADGAA